MRPNPTIFPLALAAFAGGCLSPAEPPPVRTFTPVLAEPTAVDAAGIDLALAPLGAAGMVESRFAWRLSPSELAFDELHRWADHPRTFAERALRAQWFGSGALREVRTAREAAWTVTVDVEVFELQKTGAQGSAEVALRIRAARGGVVETVVRAKARGDGTPEGLATAMGQALDEAARLGRAWLIEAASRSQSG